MHMTDKTVVSQFLPKAFERKETWFESAQRAVGWCETEASKP